MWPSIGPLNVWDLDLQAWCLFATAADQYADDQRTANRPDPSDRRRR